MLYIFGGLPGVGKSELARALAQESGAVYLRIDTIEQALRDSGMTLVGAEGYEVAYRLAADNLRLARNVVADSVNPLRITRDAWRNVARRCNAPFIEIEVICSDALEHRQRIESRTADVPGLVLPTWAAVLNREYEPWDRARIVIDTSGLDSEQSIAMLKRMLESDRDAT